MTQHILTFFPHLQFTEIFWEYVTIVAPQGKLKGKGKQQVPILTKLYKISPIPESLNYLHHQMIVRIKD